MLITKEQYITASGSYPERLKSEELTEEVHNNIDKLLEVVNSLLTELGVKEVKVSSGFRPSFVNSKIQGAAKKSYHSRGLAIDMIDDKNQTLGKLFASKPELLRKYGLFIEDLSSTKGKYSNWLHVDLGIRSDRPSRMFKP